MSIPDFTVSKGPVPKKVRPAASFNMSGDGPLINGGPAKPVSPDPVRQSTPQTRSPASNVSPAQFKGKTAVPSKPAEYVGKRRAPSGRHAAPSSDSGYRGPHAKGSHAQDYDMQADLDKSRATKQYTGSHSARAPKPIGKHGKPYNAAADINKDLNQSGKAPYVPKHTPQGQATRAKAAKVAQRQQTAAGAYGKARNVQHALHVFQRSFHGKHYTEHLRAMETRLH